jgi:peptide-methionine (S)-S-oxide reductase
MRMVFGAVLVTVALGVWAGQSGAAAPKLPDPAVDDPPSKGSATLVVAGGCFWGIEEVFQHVKGVTNAVSGYSGGSARNAEYELVSTGTTGHAESVKITYDASKVTLGTLLKVYFSVAHDPTQLNRQGPDTGPQDRSALFFYSVRQLRIVKSYIAHLKAAKAFSRPIVTQVVPLTAFYEAEAEHQDFAVKHPTHRYIVMNDAPKVADLRREFPQLYR